MRVLALFIIVVYQFIAVGGERTEIFSSAESLRRTVEYVKTSEFLPYLKDYVYSRKVLLSRLLQVVQNIEDLQSLLGEDEFTVEYPTYAYKFIRRQAFILEDIHSYLHEIQRTAFDHKWKENFMEHLPDTTDLIGSAQGITRLIETYHFTNADFLGGNFKGHTAIPLTAKEIYDMGKSMTDSKMQYRRSEYNALFRWINLAKLKLKDEDHKTIEERVIVALEANTYIRVGCLCSIEVRTLLNKSSFSMRKLKLLRRRRCNKTISIKCKPKVKSDTGVNIVQKFQKLCHRSLAGFVADSTNTTVKPLLCHLVHNQAPRLILQPTKLEEVRTDIPYIAVMHDIIRDKEIRYFRENSRPKLERGMTLTREGGLQQAEIKVSQQVFLSVKQYDKSIVNLRNRLAAATKLNIKGFERIQVANYAAGGYYNSHIDSNFFKSTAPEKYIGKDNRLATVVMYMNDVEEGGATAFPYLGVAVQPKKGNALLFFNLHRSNIVNIRARHGGCSVISGEKWIATQWITTYHKEFHHRCTLDSTD